MAAIINSNMDIPASFAGILNEKHRSEHLQVLKTFTTALRDKDYRCGQSNLLHVERKLRVLAYELTLRPVDYSVQLNITGPLLRASFSPGLS